MKKVQYVTANIALLNGSNSTSEKIDIPVGTVSVASIFPVGTPSKEVDLFIKDAQSRNELIPATNWRDWQDGSGEYFARKKPMQFNGSRAITVHATSETNQTADFLFQIVFVVITEA